MSTADMTAIYAYLKIIPAENNPSIGTDSKPAALNGAPSAVPTQYDEGDVTRALPTTPDPDNTALGLAIRPLDAPTNLATLPADKQAAIWRGSYLANAA